MTATIVPTAFVVLMTAVVVGVIASGFRRPDGAREEYVWVDDDGSARALTPDEERYLATTFDPTDGGRPYVKRTYSQRTPDGRLRGYLERRKLPRRVAVRPAAPPDAT